MDKEELFAAAKLDIFGETPECPMAKIGRRMAMGYFMPVLHDAESVMLDMRVPHDSLVTTLQNAFTFSQESSFEAFPEKTKAALDECAEKFKARYEPLLQELTLRAA